MSLSIQPAATSMLPDMLPPHGLDGQLKNASQLGKANNHDKQSEVHEKFTQFVGETFYGQMIKAMQSTVGKPAYFHGGRGEEAFRGQLNQQLAEHMTKATAERFADPMFQRQFPNFDLK